MGRIDTEQLFNVTTSERILHYMRYFREHQMKKRFPVCSLLAGKHIEQVTTIQDLEGAHIGMLNK
ncbi:MAG: hypothetical protein ACKO96_34760 [Flammeovirgaceae bacterium]